MLCNRAVSAVKPGAHMNLVELSAGSVFFKTAINGADQRSISRERTRIQRVMNAEHSETQTIIRYMQINSPYLTTEFPPGYSLRSCIIPIVHILTRTPELCKDDLMPTLTASMW